MRIYFILASLALALTLTACGGGSAGGGTPPPIDIGATQFASIRNLDSMGRKVMILQVQGIDGSWTVGNGTGNADEPGLEVGYVDQIWSRDLIEKHLPPAGDWVRVGAEFEDGENVWSEEVWFVPGQPHLQMDVDGLRKPAFQEIEE